MLVHDGNMGHKRHRIVVDRLNSVARRKTNRAFGMDKDAATIRAWKESIKDFDTCLFIFEAIDRSEGILDDDTMRYIFKIPCDLMGLPMPTSNFRGAIDFDTIVRKKMTHKDIISKLDKMKTHNVGATLECN